MTAQELREKYLHFFASKGHTIIPSASLVPRDTDASVLFTTAGMHPLVPYLLGETHPGGKRVVNVQKCVRTGDIDDVGDNRHNTFFEMLGNWSFGDYFKREAIEWSFEFLTGPQWLNLDPKRLYVTVFRGEPASPAGGDGIPRDEESIQIWKDTFFKIGMQVEVAGDDENITGDVRILPMGTDDNFWIAGSTGPCGGDTEMFYDTRPEDGKLEGKFSDLVNNFRLIEIWNNVFIEFEKKADGTLEKLAKPNVDTGMGVERTMAVLNGKETIFETELFEGIFHKIAILMPQKMEPNIPYSEEITPHQQWYTGLSEEKKHSARIIADHIRASVFMISDGVTPLNIGRGYVLRRIIRRMIRHGKLLGINTNFIKSLSYAVFEKFGEFYSELRTNESKIVEELEKEENKFRETLEKGMKEFAKIAEKNISGKEAFDLYQSYGFPFELTRELATEKGLKVDEKEFQEELKGHQDLSRTASAGIFKGGLQSQDENTAKLHTATHLLNAALRDVLGPHVFQKGSNITSERLRFDFAHHEKMTPEQIEKVEHIVNEKIRENIPMFCQEMTVEEAKNSGAVGVFDSKYGDTVKVYSASNFSKEICGGPHASATGELGHFKIIKEEASSAGVRRIKAILE